MDLTFLCRDDISGQIVSGCLGTNGSHTYLNWVISALFQTVLLSVSSLILAVIVGILIGTMRTLPHSPILRAIGTIWVEIMRNIPLLVQIFIWYFVIPKVFPSMYSFPPLLLVIFALGFFTSARIAEQVRSGIESIPTGQLYAGQALGFTTFQTYRYVILPRALRTIMPPLISESMGIVKNSAVAFAVSINELMQYQYQAIEEVSHVYENYLIVTVLYVIIAMVIFLVMSVIENMIKVPGFQAEGRS